MADYGLGGMMDSMRPRNIHHSDIVLDCTNYFAWKLTIQCLLDGIRVWGRVDGTPTMLTDPTIPDSSSSSVYDTDAPI